jgi:hypothetical protein
MTDCISSRAAGNNGLPRGFISSFNVGFDLWT